MITPKVYQTKDYSLFERIVGNRWIDRRYYYNEDSKHKLIVTVELYHEGRQNLYTTYEQSDHEPVENLIYKDEERSANSPRSVGLGKTLMW